MSAAVARSRCTPLRLDRAAPSIRPSACARRSGGEGRMKKPVSKSAILPVLVVVFVLAHQWTKFLTLDVDAAELT